jgi:hypothetical protein
MPTTSTSIESSPLSVPSFPLDWIPALSVLVKAVAEEVARMLKPEVAKLAVSTLQPALLDVKQAAIYPWCASVAGFISTVRTATPSSKKIKY